MFKSFTTSAQGANDFSVEVISVKAGTEAMMAIMATTEAIYITREQAMEFFGLVPAPAVKPTMLPRAAALTAFIANMPAKPAVATEYEDTDQMGTVKSTMTERIAQALAAEAKSV